MRTLIFFGKIKLFSFRSSTASSMSDTERNASLPATIQNEISTEQKDENDSEYQHHLFLSSDSVDSNVENGDTLSVAYTSCSDCSNNVCNLESNGLDFRPNFIEKVDPSNANIGSVCVENSTNVTFGNKTYFNGPVIIKHFVVDGSSVEASKTQEERSDKLNPLKTSTEHTFDGKRARKSMLCLRNKSPLVVFTVGSVAVIVITLLFAGYYVYLLDNNSAETNSTTDYDGSFEFIERNKYGAQPPKSKGEPLALPVRHVIISHTVTPNCTDYSSCASRVLQIQDYHMNVKRWDDIGLNFLVGGDGRAYEGCGYTVGAHTINYNQLSVCIAFIGDFQLYEAPEKQLKAAQRLIDYGISMNKIHPDYVLYGQRQLRNFDSPGILLFNQIMLWPHWSKDVLPL